MATCVVPIAYSNSWLSQTENLSTTSVFTSSSGGLYRVTFSGMAVDGLVAITVASSIATASGQIGSEGATAISVVALYLTEGDSITVASNIESDGIGSYSLFLTIEQLQ